MNTITKNQKLWSDFGWERKGEHWSDGWGNSRAQWLFAVYPRIARHLPAGSVVEIATGHGRWTQYLIEHAETYVGFDLVEKCAVYCEEHYGGNGRRFVANDGLHLTGVPDRSVDFVFSLDSLVHVDWPTLRSYLSEIMRVLTPGGTAHIHHSNAAAVKGFESLDPPKRKAFRAADVSAEVVREEIKRLGGGVTTQEIVDWGGSGPDALIDCFTTISAQPATPAVVENPNFMLDMRRIAKISGLYT